METVLSLLLRGHTMLRKTVLVGYALLATLLAACSASATAPTNKADGPCSGYVSSSGDCIPGH